ncbi:hypothetical protein CMV_003057 [Castanea mollissima]|uniref:Uncharacterized protein n=1 Tax=Castanea mollissima TaxID=60419 RepID=A0A8J4RHW1_9ROSI|nr:hypothetical protein CMV_003057 [Castanea mollissima]
MSDPSRNSFVICKESSLGQREQLGEKFVSNFSRKNRVTCKESTLGQGEQLGVEILSSINGIESEGIKSELSLDLVMRLDRGLDGKWAIGAQALKSTKLSLGKSGAWARPSVERQMGESSSGSGSKPTSVLGDQVTGTELATRCNFKLAKLDSGEANPSGFATSGAAVTHRLGSRDSGLTGGMGFNSVVAMIEPSMLTEVPLILHREPWEVQNGFSPPSVSGNGSEAEFGVDDSGCGSGEKDICVFECEPLSQWEPKQLSEGLLVQDSAEEAQGTEFGPPSNWVSQLMSNFCKMVGFPIVKHKAQCLALFRILEQECLKVNDEGVFKRNTNSGTRGLRELKGLISYVNYDGVSSRGRSRASLTALGVVGSFK